MSQIGRSARPNRIAIREKPTKIAQDAKLDLVGIEKKIDNYAESTLGKASIKGERVRGTGRLSKQERVLR